MAEQTEEVVEITADVEIVGLNASSNGRSCCQHAICGVSLQVGDVVKLVDTMVESGGSELEPALKVVIIRDGAATCTVGFIPRALAALPKVQRKKAGFLQVVELYKNSQNLWKKQLDAQYKGMAGAVFLDSIPNPE